MRDREKGLRAREEDLRKKHISIYIPHSHSHTRVSAAATEKESFYYPKNGRKEGGKAESLKKFHNRTTRRRRREEAAINTADMGHGREESLHALLFITATLKWV